MSYACTNWFSYVHTHVTRISSWLACTYSRAHYFTYIRSNWVKHASADWFPTSRSPTRSLTTWSSMQGRQTCLDAWGPQESARQVLTCSIKWMGRRTTVATVWIYCRRLVSGILVQFKMWNFTEQYSTCTGVEFVYPCNDGDLTFANPGDASFFSG